MAEQYEAIKVKLKSPHLAHHERQILEAARVMLCDFMLNKARDVRRTKLGKE